MWLLEAAIVPLLVGVSLAYGQFTGGVNLVEVYATVTGAQGRPVTGLTAADFRIAEDGASQAISAFAAGEFPLSIAIGLDRSFSMAGRDNRLGVAKSAARIDVATFKERFGVTRKFAIPLLEYLDRERVTRRVGESRVLL